MDLSIIGYSERVRKFYLHNNKLKIHKILRKKKVNKEIFTTNIYEILNSKYILISLSQKKTFQYILRLKKLEYKGIIMIETPSISIYRYLLNRINKKIIVIEDLIYSRLILKIVKIIKKEGLEKIILINRGYFILYHFLSIIYYWNHSKLPKLYKYKRGYYYLKTQNFNIKTNLVKKTNSSIYIKVLTNQNKYKFILNQNTNIKKNNTEYFLKYVHLINKSPLTIQDYNKINSYSFFLKIMEKALNIFRI